MLGSGFPGRTRTGDPDLWRVATRADPAHAVPGPLGGLQLAARLLESGGRHVAQAASAVGYQSEAAFNRAFKREVGEAPGLWRRGQEGHARPSA